MIQLLRVDDRLIHGQVAVYWVKAVNASTIVVASDKYAENSVLKMSLNVGKPAGVKMPVLTIEKAIEYLNDPKNDKKKIFVVTGSCADALALCKGVNGIEAVDIGGIRHAEGRVSVSSQVHLLQEDMDAIESMAELGKDVYVQEVPSKSKMPLNEIRANFKK
ncbi:MAG: PTS sugar transporter subunit IIB [Solobacterium sp.]|nr:PTS sugar transporter subunit IIB [Solobacterium sp.]MDO4192276.1 PTS sugar transporter subunit IIB [Erysipelotrichaceae bacterium]MBR2845769.1 PTS sugar transporter subunit IIB [Solobacterium sp.]MBR3342882.1 PTS sugar transporter subunit IIB [Solobacterium sp.]MCR5450327.1 PTS sugar transporter subunit IIB [Solobacterium sp.]